ncbi:MAG: hypothetical protein QW304_09485 [Thermoproteota archaeon]
MDKPVNPSGDTTTDNFLIAQFNALASHVIGLFNLATQRIAAYLVFAGVLLTAVSIALRHPEHEIYVLGALIGFLIVGSIIWYLTIRLLIQVTRYLRIINGIRGYFAQRDPQIEQLLTNVLPTSTKLPAWDQPTFDPGLRIVELILAATIALLANKIILATGVSLALGWRILCITIPPTIVWAILVLVKRRMLWVELNINLEDPAGASYGKQTSVK